MKKFLTAAMVVMTALSLGACASSAAKSGGTESAKDTSTKDTSAESAGEAKAEGSYAGKTLIMATNAEFPPYEYHEGKDIVGLSLIHISEPTRH